MINIMGPCEKKVQEERAAELLKSKLGQTITFENKSYKIEKVDSQHFYIRNESGELSIIKHNQINS